MFRFAWGMLVMAATVAASGTMALATHIPSALDVAVPWTPLPGDGYLNFMTPGAFIPIGPAAGSPPPMIAPGGIFKEEHTGWTNLLLVDIIDPLGPPVFPAGPDNDPFAGDRADIDWVQENRPHETGGGPSNHLDPVGTPISGALGWNVAPTMASPHTTGGVPHGHSLAEGVAGGFPELANNDYTFTTFDSVDVFSIYSTNQDFDTNAAGLISVREGALDYDLWFVDLLTGVSTPGVVMTVFAPGWVPGLITDDYVARWTPASAPPPGSLGWDAIAIDPTAGFGHDGVTEIDAIKVAPEPATLALLALGGMAVLRRRR